MRDGSNMDDLVALVADVCIGQTLSGLLSRSKSLGIRNISHRIIVHPNRDPGCVKGAADALRCHLQNYRHCVVILDRQGCGKRESREDIQGQVEDQLHNNGWPHGQVIVIDPELEVWVWSDSPVVADLLQWPDYQTLQGWLQREGYWPAGAAKPPNPKAAMLAAMENAPRSPRCRQSAGNFFYLASQVSLRRCQDPAFNALQQTLRQWFS